MRTSFLISPWRVLLLVGSVGLAACQAAPAASPPAAGATESARLLQALDQAIGAAECQSNAQCRTVAVGHKACGGPEGYRAYSTAGGQAAQIVALAQQQADARRREVEAAGGVSNCMLQTDPGARCSSAGRCETRPRGLAAPTY